MIPVAEARARILAAIDLGPREWVGVGEAHGRVLAEDLVALRDQPPAAVSAMDGYAIRAADLSQLDRWLDVVGHVPAGQAFGRTMGPGEAVRIFTGATLPDGADAVALQEDAEADGTKVRFVAAVAPGRHVRPKGLDFHAGDIKLRAGAYLDPRAVGLAASLAHGWLPVRRRMRVAILATGDELVQPGRLPGPNQIVSSNSLALGAMVRSWGGEPVDLGIALDRPEALTAVIPDLRQVDLVVTCGGASVGEHDLVRGVLGQGGLDLDFWKIAMRPGKPLMFGRIGGTPMLGLPGNPVSSAVCALLFVRAAIRRHLGRDSALTVEEARLASPLPANDQREDYLRARRVGERDGLWLVDAAPKQDSSMFSTFAEADALVIRAPHAPAAPAGAPVAIVKLAGAFSAG